MWFKQGEGKGDLRRSFTKRPKAGPRPSDEMGSRGQQRGHVTPERATLATRTSDACVIRCSKGKEGKLQPGRRSNGVGPGKLSAPTSSSARLRSCIWLVAFQSHFVLCSSSHTDG